MRRSKHRENLPLIIAGERESFSFSPSYMQKSISPYRLITLIETHGKVFSAWNPLPRLDDVKIVDKRHRWFVHEKSSLQLCITLSDFGKQEGMLHD